MDEDSLAILQEAGSVAGSLTRGLAYDLWSEPFPGRVIGALEDMDVIEAHLAIIPPKQHYIPIKHTSKPPVNSVRGWGIKAS